MRFFINLILTLSIFSTSFAQNKNVFHDRNFWKENPSIDTINKYINEGHDPASLNRFSFDAVSWALIENTDNKTVKFLLSLEGNDVNKLTHDDRTYIFWAAYRNNLEMMKYLIDKGAKTDIIDSHGYSLINFAAVTGQTSTKLYDFIIAHGAVPKKELNLAGANALLLVAPFLKDFELVKYFKNKGLSIRSTDTAGNGIFNYATKGGNTDFLDELISKGLPYKNFNKKGGNAAIFAGQGTRGKENGLELYKYLAEQGVALNVVGNEGKNPLHYLVSHSKNTELFSFLINKGVSINLQDDNGETPLMLAVKNRNPEILKFFINHKANLDLTDFKGNGLPFYLINSYNDKYKEAFETKLKLLQANEVKISKPQAKGNTLYHIAVEKGI